MARSEPAELNALQAKWTWSFEVHRVKALLGRRHSEKHLHTLIASKRSKVDRALGATQNLRPVADTQSEQSHGARGKRAESALQVRFSLRSAQSNHV